MTDLADQATLKTIAIALLNTLNFHRSEILNTIEPQIPLTQWDQVRSKVLNHLGEKGIEGQIKDLLGQRHLKLGAIK